MMKKQSVGSLNFVCGLFARTSARQKKKYRTSSQGHRKLTSNHSNELLLSKAELDLKVCLIIIIHIVIIIIFKKM